MRISLAVAAVCFAVLLADCGGGNVNASATCTYEITGAIRRGFNRYIENLPGAVAEVLTLAMHGQAGDRYTEKMGMILKCMNKNS